jgi:hypothetical protein
MLARDRCESRFSIAHSRNAKRLSFKVHARKLNDGWFVVDEQDEFVQVQ